MRKAIRILEKWRIGLIVAWLAGCLGFFAGMVVFLIQGNTAAALACVIASVFGLLFGAIPILQLITLRELSEEFAKELEKPKA